MPIHGDDSLTTDKACAAEHCIMATSAGPFHGDFMKTLIAIDGSNASLQAVRWVMSQAAAGLVSDLVLVNVQAPASLYEVVTAHDAKVIEQVRSNAGADLMREAEALLMVAGHDFESEVAGGVPEHLIVELAENYGCDHIVIGSRGRGDSALAGLGAVARAVLAHSSVPVTVVRAAETAADDKPGSDSPEPAED
jgi:nucleotide-binding universal stress UspA family protein